jgi:hypothetical protein
MQPDFGKPRLPQPLMRGVIRHDGQIVYKFPYNLLDNQKTSGNENVQLCKSE